MAAEQPTPVFSVQSPKPRLFRRSLRLPECKVSSIRFGDDPAVTAPRPKRADVPPPAPSRRAVTLGKRQPPAGVPIRDKLLSLLQPPITQLLGTDRFWLPFEPFPYQVEGIHFLSESWGAILADEMGLGKTMQTVIAARLLLRGGSIGSVLLVCPKPLVTNWVREFALWAEDIPVAVIEGPTDKRHTLWRHDRRPVKLANYESLSRDAGFLTDNGLRFDLVVLDEAQRIKNFGSKTADAVHDLRRKRSWALTGTPVENVAGDLVSLLTFVHNDGHAIEDRPDHLKDEVGKVLLRRTKDLVMKDMPPRLIQDKYLDLTPVQRGRYDTAEREGIMQLNDLGDSVTIEHVFDLIRRLKQVCNFDPLTRESAKADQLLADMEEVVASGKKAILFSQYVTTLDHLADVTAHHNPLVYHGRIPQKQRDPVLAEFKESPDRPLLMLSYATGAVGLNLQFTNYVFLYDRWWNPAIEDQAINRAHRVGQKEPVIVSRYISPDTIEERIALVLEQKRELFNYLIDDQDNPDLGVLTPDDVFGLFDLKIGKAA